MFKIIPVETADGSITYHNSDVDETYHSKSGAIDEALRKHVIPSKILEQDFHNIVIGDVCFGLGYNTIVAIAKLLEKNPTTNIQVFAFENDYVILNEINNISLPYEYKDVHKKIIKLINSEPIEKEENFSLHIFDDKNLTITLYVGDMLNTLPIISDDVFDVIFFDPFSPQKNPYLWSKEAFENTFRSMKQGSLLTTYSCARMVRDNMRAVGFKVIDGPSVGRRAPSTIAIKP